MKKYNADHDLTDCFGQTLSKPILTNKRSYTKFKLLNA